MLETSFETFEWNVRDQLGRVLGPGGFDPAIAMTESAIEEAHRAVSELT